MLKYIPGSFEVIRHAQSKESCTRCDAVLEAEAPGEYSENWLQIREASSWKAGAPRH
jgi:transposase